MMPIDPMMGVGPGIIPLAPDTLGKLQHTT